MIKLRQWNTPKFGTCAVCGARKTVTQAGVIIRSHAPCKGAGKPPKTEEN